MSPVNVVVVGHGMVGARFAEEVRRHDPDGRRVRLIVLAAEPRPAYNRVLLPNLLSGIMKEEDFTATEVAGLPLVTGELKTRVQNGSVLHPDAPMSLRVGAAVIGIDIATKTVLVQGTDPAGPFTTSTRDRFRATGAAKTQATESGTAEAGIGDFQPGTCAALRSAGPIERISYDILVLATGAQAVTPSVPGVLAQDDASDTSQGPRTCAPGSSAIVDTSTSAIVDTSTGGAVTSGQPESASLPGQSARAGTGVADGEARTRYESPRLSADVVALRSLADARHIAAFAQSARRTSGRVAVLGGGVLGLEAARALTARGTAVTVVHRGGHLMDRQLDGAAGRVLADAMRRTGVEVSLGVGAARWEPGRGLWLADGNLVRASALVLCAGTTPCAELARDAGLRLTEGGAVAVDDTLATSVADIHAIGDCAGHPGAAGGLVQPGWEQAAVLAGRLTGASPRARYRGSGAVTRLKAAGIELTAVGASLAEPGTDPDLEVLRFEDPARERYAKLVLAQDRVVGAVLIGLPDAAAGIVQLYDRDAPAPADRLALLLGRALPPEAGGASGPRGSGVSALPDYAVVCRCNMVTKGQLRDAWYAGACGRAGLSAATRAATGCGTCGDDLDVVAAWLAETDPSQAPPAPAAAAAAAAAGPADKPADDPTDESRQQAEKEPVLR